LSATFRKVFAEVLLSFRLLVLTNMKRLPIRELLAESGSMVDCMPSLFLGDLGVTPADLGVQPAIGAV